MDITLGLAVESGGVRKGAGDLDKLTNASKRAEAASNGFSASASRASAAAVAAANAFYQESKAKTAAARAAENATRADIQGATAAQRLAKAALEAARAEHARVTASNAAARADTEAAAAADRLANARKRVPGAVPIVPGRNKSPWDNRPPDNDNVPVPVRGGGAANLSNIAAQFQDIAVSAQMGMGLMQIALQQGTQLAAVLGTMDKPLQGLGAAFMSVLSPVSLITIGLIALVTAGIQMVNWGKAAAAVVTALAGVLQQAAPYAAMLAATLGLIYAPAIIGGIVSLIALIARTGVAATIAGGQMAAAWLVGLGPIGALIAGVGAIAIAAYALRDEIKQVFGIDVVGVMKTAANYVIGSFVGAFEAIKATWSLLPAALGDLTYSTANAVIKGIEAMINKAIGLINNAINDAKMAALKMGMPINIDFLNPVQFEEVGNPYKGAASKTASAASDAMKGAMGRDWVGDIGTAIGDGAAYASGKLKELSGWLTKVDEDKKSKKGSDKSETEKYSDIVDGANRRIASLQAEQAALGLTEFAAAKLAYETDLLNEAQSRGISLTAAQRAELSTLAGTMAGIEVATKKAREAMDFAKDVTKGFFTDFRAGIEQGKSIWESFANAALNALNKIVDKLLNDVLDAVFQVHSAGNGGKGGGFLSSIFGGLFGGGGGKNWGAMSASGKYLFDSGGVHLGSNVVPFGPKTRRIGSGILADSGLGPSHFPAVLEKGEAVLTDSLMRRTMRTIDGLGAANNNQQAASNYNVPVSITIDATGADAAGLARVEQQLARLKKEIPSLTINAIQDARKRNMRI